MLVYVKQFSIPKGEVSLELQEREDEGEGQQTREIEVRRGRHTGLVKICDGASGWSLGPSTACAQRIVPRSWIPASP